MSRYFVNLAPGCRVNRPGKDPVDLRQLPTDKTCKKLYLSGFSYIGLKPEAVEILDGCPNLILVKLIAQKIKENKPQEALILKSLLKVTEAKTTEEVKQPAAAEKPKPSTGRKRKK